MPRAHGAKALSGLGRAAPFTRHATIPRSPRPQRREGRVGQCCWDQIPEIVSEYLPLIFLGDLDGVQKLERHVLLERNNGMKGAVGRRAQRGFYSGLR